MKTEHALFWRIECVVYKKNQGWMLYFAWEIGRLEFPSSEIWKIVGSGGEGREPC